MPRKLTNDDPGLDKHVEGVCGCDEAGYDWCTDLRTELRQERDSHQETADIMRRARDRAGRLTSALDVLMSACVTMANGPGEDEWWLCHLCGSSGDTAGGFDHCDDCAVVKARAIVDNSPGTSPTESGE